MSGGVERRGFLLNEFTGAREYFVLRGGVLRIRQGPKGKDTGSLYLAHGATASLQVHGVIELTAGVPYQQEYILAAPNEAEAEAWYDAIQAAIKEEQAKLKNFLEFLIAGCTMNKYNYSNSKKSRRFFWISDSESELCWGRTKGEDMQKVNLRECIGIIYGPMTTTFQRCEELEDPSWSCFSLLFMGRTLDLAVAGGMQVHAWFLGLQNLILRFGIGSMPTMSNAQFIARKVQLMLMDAAHREQLVLGRYLIKKIKQAGMGKTGLGKGALVSGGQLEKGLTAVNQQSEGLKLNMSSKKRRGSQAGDDAVAEKRNTLHERVLDLQAQLRNRTVEVEVARQGARLDGRSSSGKLQEKFREVAKEKYQAICGTLEQDSLRLGDANAEAQGPAKAAEKTDKGVKKMQAKLDEILAKKNKIDQELAAVRSSAEKSSGSTSKSSNSEAAVKARCEELQRKVKDLESKLEAQSSSSASVAEEEQKKNREQAQAISKAKDDRLLHEQKLDALKREHARIAESEEQSAAKLGRIRAMHSRLGQTLGPLKKTVARLRDEQRRARDSTSDIGRGFGVELTKVQDATASMGSKFHSLQAQLRSIIESKQKLHNQVLELKGNVRIFIRVRPMIGNDAAGENKSEPTASFKDETGIGIFDSSGGRRKWFDYDLVFKPVVQVKEMFEQVQPLAVSILDGYNSCVFAYGASGTGKTTTMRGISKENPGLHARLLGELLRLKKERVEEGYSIELSLSIAEISGDTVKDLVKVERLRSAEDYQRSFDEAAQVNGSSSQAHHIVTVSANSTMKGCEPQSGKMHIVDLASSAKGDEAEKSLVALGEVFAALIAKSGQVPYRNSKLTTYLKDELGGDNKALMLVHCSPAQANVAETSGSLSYASRLRNAGEAAAKADKKGDKK